MFKIKALTLITLSLALFSCRSMKTFDDLGLIRKINEGETATTKVYMIGSKPIDSVDQAKLIFDVWKIDTKSYPDSIKLFVRVMDSNGYFVNKLARPYCTTDPSKYWTNLKEDLMVRSAIKRSAKIDKFDVREYGEQDSIPYDIMLALDYSGSMEDVKDALFEGTEMFVSQKMKYDKIAIGAFAKKFELKSKFYQNKDVILSEFRANREKGFGSYSSLFDGLKESIKLLAEQPSEEPRILVAFTDGYENNSKANISDVYKLAKEANVNLFLVGYGFTDDTGLEALANYTGGKYYHAYSKEELKKIFADIFRSLRNYYLVTYHPPEYYGEHKVDMSFKAPLRLDSLHAYASYDMGMLNFFNTDSNNSFSTTKILFDFAKADLKPESMPMIEEIADNLNKYPNIRLEIRGHTDNVGGVELNQKLSEDRAKVVLDALVSKGVEAKRLRFRGFGMSMPLLPNDTEENRARNRRTEFVIIAK